MITPMSDEQRLALHLATPELADVEPAGFYQILGCAKHGGDTALRVVVRLLDVEAELRAKYGECGDLHRELARREGDPRIAEAEEAATKLAACVELMQRMRTLGRTPSTHSAAYTVIAEELSAILGDPVPAVA